MDYKKSTSPERREFIEREFLKNLGVVLDPDKPIPLQAKQTLRFIKSNDLMSNQVVTKKELGYTQKQMSIRLRLTIREIRTVLKRCNYYTQKGLPK